MRTRSAVVADYAAFKSLFGELGLDEPCPSFERWTSEVMFHTFVAERNGNICGYVTFSKLGTLGHVRNLVVTPDARNRGIGRRLMDAAADALRAAGAVEWHLNVRADNAPAIRLYEHLGLRAEHRSTVVRVRWDALGALPTELAIPLSVDHDADIEAAFGFPAGRVEMARRPGRVLAQLRDKTLAVVGFCAFDPELAQAMPFRVTRVALAATLLARVRPHARHEHVQIVAENHPALADALVSIGGEKRLSLLHYTGPLTTEPVLLSA